MVDNIQERYKTLMEDTTRAVWDGGMMHCDGPEEVARRAIVAVFSFLAEVAPGTPEYAAEFDFDAMADHYRQAA